jgi:hypothetical protein
MKLRLGTATSKPDTTFQSTVTEFIASQQPSFFVTAILYNCKSVLAMEDVLNEWLIRLNRCYLGRNWHTPKFKYRGMVAFMELRTRNSTGDLHAFLLVRPPKPADPEDFRLRASLVYLNQMLASFSGRGEMKVLPIEALGSDADNIASNFISNVIHC